MTQITPAFSEVPSLKRGKEYDANISVRVIKEIEIPKSYHEGLYFDGENVWLCNGEGGNIWIIDPETGSIVSEVVPPAEFTEGITPAGDGTYWVTDWDEKKLYRVKIEGDKTIPQYDISLAPARPAGLLWTGEHLYVITWTRGVGTTYHLMQLDDEKKNMVQKVQIKRIHEPAHLAWDGKHLWVTSWYSKRVYKIDVETFKVLGSFKSPAKATTGIAWDGKYFWITGTHADLYQIAVGEE